MLVRIWLLCKPHCDSFTTFLSFLAMNGRIADIAQNQIKSMWATIYQFTDDFPIKTSIYKGCSIAMLHNQMVRYLVPFAQHVSLQNPAEALGGESVAREPRSLQLQPASSASRVWQTPSCGCQKFRGKNTYIFDGFKMLKYVKNLFSPSRTVIFWGVFPIFI